MRTCSSWASLTARMVTLGMSVAGMGPLADEHHEGVGELADGLVGCRAGEAADPKGRLRHRGVHALQHRIDAGHGEFAGRDALFDDLAEDVVMSSAERLDSLLMGFGPVGWDQEQA